MATTSVLRRVVLVVKDEVTRLIGIVPGPVKQELIEEIVELAVSTVHRRQLNNQTGVLAWIFSVLEGTPEWLRLPVFTFIADWVGKSKHIPARIRPEVQAVLNGLGPGFNRAISNDNKVTDAELEQLRRMAMNLTTDPAAAAAAAAAAVAAAGGGVIPPPPAHGAPPVPPVAAAGGAGGGAAAPPPAPPGGGGAPPPPVPPSPPPAFTIPEADRNRSLTLLRSILTVRNEDTINRPQHVNSLQALMNLPFAQLADVQNDLPVFTDDEIRDAEVHVAILTRVRSQDPALRPSVQERAASTIAIYTVLDRFGSYFAKVRSAGADALGPFAFWALAVLDFFDDRVTDAQRAWMWSAANGVLDAVFGAPDSWTRWGLGGLGRVVRCVAWGLVFLAVAFAIVLPLVLPVLVGIPVACVVVGAFLVFGWYVTFPVFLVDGGILVIWLMRLAYDAIDPIIRFFIGKTRKDKQASDKGYGVEEIEVTESPTRSFVLKVTIGFTLLGSIFTVVALGLGQISLPSVGFLLAALFLLACLVDVGTLFTLLISRGERQDVLRWALTSGLKVILGFTVLAMISLFFFTKSDQENMVQVTQSSGSWAVRAAAGAVTGDPPEEESTSWLPMFRKQHPEACSNSYASSLPACKDADSSTGKGVLYGLATLGWSGTVIVCVFILAVALVLSEMIGKRKKGKGGEDAAAGGAHPVPHA